MPTAQPLRTGDPQRLGEYELSGRLGEGGQGTVFLGSLSGEAYAVKLLHGPVGDERAAFLREVELAKHVARFCTAQVIDAGFDEGRPYIVSEYVDGPSLQREVALTGPRRDGALERLAVSTATALAAIHRAGIVHRDFKPQNVLLGSDGPRVIDFGLARALDAAATVSGRGVGTPAYMAPEQITALAVTGAADVFSWGATMCFAANASAPFGQDSVAPVLHRILTAQPALGRLEGRLRTLVDACLDKDARNRPSSRELLFELLGESSQEVPAEVLRSPPPHILRAPAPLIPEPRAPSSDSDPHVPLADSDLRVPPADSGPHVLPIGSAPRSPTADSAPRASADGSGAGRPLAEPETTGTPGGYRLPDPAGGEGPSRGWPRAAIAVCAALLVTAVVLLTLVIPTLNRSDALPGPQAGGPPVPAKSRPATSKPPATSEPPTAKQSQGPREPVIDPPVAPPPTVAIPLLAGLDKGAASKAVKKAGLVLGPVTRVDSPRRIGQVLSSRPASGTFARKGSTVSLQVSAGLAVPAVAGMQRRAAEAALTGAGLTVGAVTRSCSAEPNGRVLSSTPKAGRRVQGGTAVSLTVALKGATAPAVVGQAREDARAALSAAGFTVQTKDQVVEDESQVGTVLAQSVQPGVCGAAGSPVVITVGVAAPPDPGEPTETPTAPIAGE